jgi:hypothetical protein
MGWPAIAYAGRQTAPPALPKKCRSEERAKRSRPAAALAGGAFRCGPGARNQTGALPRTQKTTTRSGQRESVTQYTGRELQASPTSNAPSTAKAKPPSSRRGERTRAPSPRPPPAANPT